MSLKALKLLTSQITECRRCPRLVEYRESIARTKRRQYQNWNYWGRPVPGFGVAQARVYVIGLAPAAHGGNRTGRVFTGDRSGDWLYEALHQFGFANQPHSTHLEDGLVLKNCYIAAAVRCAPPGNKPTSDEFASCQPYLVDELKTLKKLIAVVALGKIAFDHYLKACQALGFPALQPRPHFQHGTAFTLPWGIRLFTSYHPSQQNTFTGKLTRPMFHRVFRAVRRFVHSQESGRSNPNL